MSMIAPKHETVVFTPLTETLTDEFCLFFTDMTYVPGQFIPYIFFQDGRLKSLWAR